MWPGNEATSHYVDHYILTRGTYMQKAKQSPATIVETLSINSRVAGEGLETSVNA